MNLSLENIFRPTVLLALALMAVIVMMVLPMPAWLLDIGLAASFALAILIFTVTLFIERPLDFSAFPTVLLASLMLRLSLNVSSTKLIIGEGNQGTSAAGDVIEGFANFVMGGNLILGLVVFCVLLIVRNESGIEVNRTAIPVSSEPYQWLGADQTGATLPPGNYSFEVEARREGEVLDTVPVELYVPITEARISNGAPVVVFASGEELPADEVSAVRAPGS